MRKIIIIGGSALLCLTVGTYAAIVASSADYYQISPDVSGFSEGICITGTTNTKYVVHYDNTKNLFVPKKTLAEWNSFLQAATGTNSIGLHDAYAYYNDDYYEEICDTYNNCTYGTPHDAQYDDTAPGCYEERWCTTPCGEVECGGQIACP